MKGRICLWLWTALAGIVGTQIVDNRTVVMDYDHVFLADKVGDPPVMVTFQVDPKGQEQTNPGWCRDDWWGGLTHHWHQQDRPWNVAVLRTAKRGDLIRRYHTTETYRLYGRVLWQTHEDRYLPWNFFDGRQLYPPPKWPFTLDDPKSVYQPFGSE